MPHFSELIELLREQSVINSEIISWGTPIMSFGSISNSKIATVGINPSNREFVDLNGNELDGSNRRFCSLNSLGINSWEDLTEDHIQLVCKSFEEYFSNNPYDTWFKKLDYIISGTSLSYYYPSNEACHLDLVPFSTLKKWSQLSHQTQQHLLESSKNFLGKLIRNSNIETLVLNGQTVVTNFQQISKIKYEKKIMKDWSLRRRNGMDVLGYSYSGKITSIGAYKFNRTIKVLGFNHNIQSSFGITNKISGSIRDWITTKVK